MIEYDSPLEQQPLRLTSTQRDVLQLLSQKDTEKYPLSNWYLGALYAIANTNNPDRFPQATHSFRELLEKLPRVTQRTNMQTVSSDGQPSRREQMQKVIEQIDPMADQLDKKTRLNKRDDLHKLWKSFESIAHHSRDVTEDKFNTHVEKFEQIMLALLAPVTAQDQEKILSILKQSNRSTSDTKRLFSLIERQGANYVFFFDKVSAPSWVTILSEKDYFSNPPPMENGNGAHIPDWPPIRYLVRVADIDPQLAINTVLSIGRTNNPLILHAIAKIALKATSVDQSLKLKQYIFDYMKLPYQYLQSNIISELIEHWSGTSEDEKSTVLEFIGNIVTFQPDPAKDEKQTRRNENRNDWTTALTPVPRFDSYAYQKILNEDIHPLIEREPYKVARILIRAVSTMIDLRKHEDEPGNEEDSSEVWCRRLDSKNLEYPESKEILVQTLTIACQKVFEKSPEYISALDNALRSKRYNIFKRLRQHLYALFPNEQTRPWISEFLLAHLNYARWVHHYEFQRMIKGACEHFGVELLTEEERATIFDAILSGPSRADFREPSGEKLTDDIFQQQQVRFHQMQFRPFSSVLFGEYSTYFHELENESKNLISDGDYSPVSEIKGGAVSFRSPKSPKDLANLTDKELLTYINEWQEEHCDENDWLVRINIPALADTFQTFFTNTIIPDNGRLNFWLQSRGSIQRPVYVRAMINGMQKCVKGKRFKQMNQWLDFCEWILSHPSQKPSGEASSGDESCENPNWHRSRQAVGDFVETCLSKDVDTPISARDPLASILQSLCTQFDWHLDQNEPTPLNDQTTDAINTTRGRALESVIDFGFWVRRHDADTKIPEVATILGARFNQNRELPLTLPEYAILGLQYYRIAHLDKKWAQTHKTDFFPQDNFSAWKAAFSAITKYHGPSEWTFRNIKSEYVFALEHLNDLIFDPKEQRDSVNGTVSILGQHLLMHYLWGMYSLDGKDNLLQRFYQTTKNNRKYWGSLFHHAGFLLHKAGNLEDALTTRATEFFDQRISTGEPAEIEEFAIWIDAECLPAEWRLDACSKVLGILPSSIKGGFHLVQALYKMLEDHPAKVIECFANITDAMIENNNVYIDTEKCKKILKVGLESRDKNIKTNATRARENLLRSGRFDFTQMND